MTNRPKMPQLESSKTVESFSSAKDCDQNLRMPLWDSFPTVFLPSENKGLKYVNLLVLNSIPIIYLNNYLWERT